MQGVTLLIVDSLGGDYAGGNRRKIKSDEMAVNASFSRKLTLNFSSWARGGKRNLSYGQLTRSAQTEPPLKFAGPGEKVSTSCVT